MSYALYNQQQASDAVWENRYSHDSLGTTGITSPQGWSELPLLTPPAILTAVANNPYLAPLYTNPVSELYRSGNLNQVLLSSSDQQCSTGCLAPITKPDPRVQSIKPLYSASVFRAAPGQILPNPYNVVGMY